MQIYVSSSQIQPAAIIETQYNIDILSYFLTMSLLLLLLE